MRCLLRFVLMRLGTVACSMDRREGLPLGRDIPDEADESRGVRAGHPSYREKRRKPRAVLAQAFDLAADADDVRDTSAGITLEIAVVLRAVWRGHQDADVSTEELLG